MGVLEIQLLISSISERVCVWLHFPALNTCNMHCFGVMLIGTTLIKCSIINKDFIYQNRYLKIGLRCWKYDNER